MSCSEYFGTFEYVHNEIRPGRARRRVPVPQPRLPGRPDPRREYRRRHRDDAEQALPDRRLPLALRGARGLALPHPVHRGRRRQRRPRRATSRARSSPRRPMKVEQSFTVARPIGDVWAFFQDISASRDLPARRRTDRRKGARHLYRQGLAQARPVRRELRGRGGGHLRPGRPLRPCRGQGRRQARRQPQQDGGRFRSDRARPGQHQGAGRRRHHPLRRHRPVRPHRDHPGNREHPDRRFRPQPGDEARAAASGSGARTGCRPPRRASAPAGSSGSA